MVYELDGQTIFEIKSLDKDKNINSSQFYEVEQNKEIFENTFNAITSQIPMLGVNIANFSSMVVSFPPDVIKGIESGAYKLMEGKMGNLKAIAVDVASGKIVNVGEIVSKLNPVAIVAVVWQIAAMITAQKFLSDINSKLRRIENVVNDIKNFLEQTLFSSIIGNLNYLQRTADTIKTQLLKESEIATYHNQLETIERECFKESDFIKSILGDKIKELENKDFKISGGSYFDSNLQTEAKEIIEKITYIHTKFNTYHILLIVRVVNTQLLSCLPINQNNSLNAIKDIDKEINSLEKIRLDFSKKMEQKISTFEGTWSWKSTNIKYREEMNKTFKTLGGGISKIEEEAKSSLKQVNQLLLQKSKSLDENENYLIELYENGILISIKKQLSTNN